MKHLLVTSTVLCSVIAATTLPAQSASTPFIEESSPTPQEEIGPLSEPRHVRFGMTPDDVRMAMRGKPDVVLAPDLWVYWGFHAAVGRERQKFDTLVVYFSGNRVVKYRLVERKAMQELMAALRQGAEGRATPGPGVAAPPAGTIVDEGVRKAAGKARTAAAR